MLKTLSLAGLTALFTACAQLDPGVTVEPLRMPIGATESGESTAAGLGFHGPVYRGTKTDGPN